jgi:predicted RNase H-like nuclease (RuvC/YqgF family)
MKTPILYHLVLASIVGFTLTSCNKSPKAKEADLKEAKQEVITAREDMNEATRDSIADFNKYKSSIETKLVENEKVISDLKAKINDKDRKNQTLYYKQLEKLQLRNTELRLKIENYKQGPTQKWELFKVDFNKDLDELGKSISNTANNNMKN